MLTLPSVRAFIWFLVALVCTVKAHDEQNGARLPFKPPCPVKRTEITFPHVIDVQNRHVTSAIPGRVSELEERSSDLTVPDAFFLEFSWRRQKLQLVLYRNEITPQTSFTEWEEDNVTYAEVNHDKCYYHGYVKGQRSSYTAISTCSGVAGYVQTDEEILFIEPTSGPQRNTGMQAHFVYTCENREPANDTHHWAPKDYDDAQIDAHWRKKRAAKRNPKYLEIFMAVAPSVVKIVGKSKVKNYVMTLLNIVSSVYQHSSLDVDIRVALVRLDFINERTAKRVTTIRNAYQTVRNFCEWAMYLYRPSDPQTHDIAVLLTREDLGPAGYAPITGLCNPIRSCAAIKDEGFTSAFIIAHEMAHVFGLFHDGHGNRCHGREYRTAIMATLVESKLNHYWWSICSQERMKSLVDYLYCLNDDPFQLEGLPDVEEPIGKSWTLNQQCILEFGEQFTLCRAEFGKFYSDSCNMLWCGNYRNPHLCRTKRGPPLPGTPCGRERECWEGQCEYKGSHAPVHGQWGYWSSWTPCSTECGVGLRYRSRKCNNPSPKYGGRNCEGGTDEMGTCLNEKCETYTDLRAAECYVWAEMNIRSGRHTWKPYPSKRSEDRCKQTCISEKTGEVVTIDIQTEDGTPCTYEDDDNICILGVCYDVGCDGVMNSTKRSDTCGVCGGDNSFCKTVTGEFLRKPSKKDEYEQVLFLPHGARNVEITKTKRSPHFLAIKDPERGDYYINGNGRPETSKKVVAEGALFNYARGQTYESLVSRGPLKKNLEIMLFPAGHLAPASISYSYTVNRDDHTLEKTKYKWKFSKWSDCSVTCGTGFQIILRNCVDKFEDTQVDDGMCSYLDHFNMAAAIVRSEPIRCTLVSDCVQTIVHNCVDKFEDTQVNDEMCSYLDMPRKDQATCHRESCDQIRYMWAMFNNYTMCTQTCGENGIKTQAYTCEKNYPNATTEYVDFHFCENVAPPNYTEPCNRFPCTLDFDYTWVMFDTYTQCSETCGDGGVQQQEYGCERHHSNGTNELVDHYFCDETETPVVEKACNRISCVSDFTYKWVVFDSECTATCGNGGFQIREYGCEKHYSDNTMEYVNLDLCEGYSASNERVPCNRIPCPPDFRYSWILLDTFTECTEPCGDEGTQRQHYECSRHHSNGSTEYVLHHFCDNDPAPNERVACNRYPCVSDITYDWVMFDTYTECSETCGEDGFKTQNYGCEKLSGDGVLEDVEDYYCEDHPAPQETVPCNRIPCVPEFTYQWSLFDTFSECSETCGQDGFKTQNYGCEKHFSDGITETVDDYFCEDYPAPQETVPCNRFPCDFSYDWVVFNTFTECSETCGEEGFKTQNYGCEKYFSDGSVESVEDYLCDDYPAPTETVPCNRIPCPLESTLQWVMFDTYTECSEPCGEEGVQSREYGCEKRFADGTFETVDDYFCDDLPTPDESVPCNRFPCTADMTYEWALFDTYSECSETCGEDGIKTQNYGCEKHLGDGSFEIVEDYFCDDFPAPDETLPCNRFPCNEDFTVQWTFFDTYTECSATCGEDGFQFRHYGCEKHYSDGTWENVQDHFCADYSPPEETVPCNRFPCVQEFTYSWIMFDTYSECSTTCGEEGFKSQEFGCEKQHIDGGKESVDDYFCGDFPDVAVPCNRFPCVEEVTYSWVLLDTFSTCSQTCGDAGIQRQEYSCGRVYSNGTTEKVEDFNCETLPSPNIIVPCNRFSCLLDFRYNWAMFDAYTDCTETCGDNGIQFQHYGCERTYPNDTTEYVDDHFCVKIAEPVEELPCNRVPCPMEWTVGEWSECSATCGMGVQTREVYCGDPIDWDENDICVDDIPTPEKICNRGPCPPKEPASCKKDKYAFCKYASVKKCRFGGFRKMCCKSCFKGSGAAYRRWTRMVRRKRRLRIKRRLKAKRRENRILRHE